MTPWLYSFMAAGSAVFCEAYYRANPGKSWLTTLWLGVPLALVVNYGIWGLTRTQSLVELAIIFSFFTAGMRLTITLAQGEVVSPGAWAGFGLVVLAAIIKGVWR